MFSHLRSLRHGLAGLCAGLEAPAVSAGEAASLIDEFDAIERLAAGAKLALVDRIDDSVPGAEGENGRARWLARHTGQSVTMANRDLETAARLDRLPDTADALRSGELTATQAHEVTSAAVLDPAAESELLAAARDSSLSELRRRAKKVRAAATDHDEKAKDAHEHRDVSSGTDEATGEGNLRVKGPASAVAQMLALLEPWVQAEFEKARADGRRERRGALLFDAVLAALRFAGEARRRGTGGLSLPDISSPAPTGPPVQILARVDVPAIVRGYTLAGETCEIDGFGPVPVAALREFLPEAAIAMILTDGVDVFNVTHFGRRTIARQQTVLDWIGGECSRLGCTATRHLQVDHRIDWAHTHVTELKALDWLCPADHRRKTDEGWALVHGRGKRRMVPPDDPAHPANAPPDRSATAA